MRIGGGRSTAHAPLFGPCSLFLTKPRAFRGFSMGRVHLVPSHLDTAPIRDLEWPSRRPGQSRGKSIICKTSRSSPPPRLSKNQPPRLNHASTQGLPTFHLHILISPKPSASHSNARRLCESPYFDVPRLPHFVPHLTTQPPSATPGSLPLLLPLSANQCP